LTKPVIGWTSCQVTPGPRLPFLHSAWTQHDRCPSL